jgi:hypothetical protein
MPVPSPDLVDLGSTFDPSSVDPALADRIHEDICWLDLVDWPSGSWPDRGSTKPESVLDLVW